MMEIAKKIRAQDLLLKKRNRTQTIARSLSPEKNEDDKQHEKPSRSRSSSTSSSDAESTCYRRVSSSPKTVSKYPQSLSLAKFSENEDIVEPMVYQRRSPRKRTQTIARSLSPEKNEDDKQYEKPSRSRSSSTSSSDAESTCYRRVSSSPKTVSNYPQSLSLAKTNSGKSSNKPQRSTISSLSDTEDEQWKMILHKLSKVEKKFVAFSKELEDIKKENRSLRKKIKKLEQRGTHVQDNDEDEEIFNGLSKGDIRKMVTTQSGLQSAVRHVMGLVYGETYLISHSMTGRAGNTHLQAKPVIDVTSMGYIRGLLKEKFSCSDNDINAKISNIQKALRKKANASS